MRLSIRYKIALNLWAMAAISTLISGLLTAWIIVRNHENLLDDRLKSTATTLISLGINSYSGLLGFEKLEGFIEENLGLEKSDQIIHVYTKNRKMMFSSSDIDEDFFYFSFDPVEKPVFSVLATPSKKYKVLTTPYKAKSGKEYFMQVAMPYLGFAEIFRTTLTEGLIVFVVLSIVGILISRILADRLLHPIKEMATAVEQFNPSDSLSWKPVRHISDDADFLSAIANAINHLALRVKAEIYNMSRTRRFLAHELKNPLTILMGEAEAVLDKKDATSEEYKEVIQSSLEEISRINQVVQTVSKITRREMAIYKPSPCNLSVWLDQFIPKWRKNMKQELQWEKPKEDMVAMIDSEMLFQLLDNLIRNIKNHTSETSTARIALSRKDQKVIISVEDNGGGLSQKMIESLNKPTIFYERVSIGLSLCQEIASICRMQLHFENLNPGLKVTVAVDV